MAGAPVADNQDGRLVDTTAVAALWEARGSRLPAARRLQIIEAVERRIEGDDDPDADIDFVLDEADVLRDALRAHIEAVLPPEQLGEARLRVGIAVADLVARAASRRLASLEATALIDPLTGLGNRRAASSAFEAALASAQRHDTPVAVALVDLVGLKRLNDEHGHAAGDAALVGLADALRASMRADDSAFRFGGDEFVVLAPVATASDLATLFDRVRVAAPAFTVGIAEAPRDGTTQDALVAVADERMYAQRQVGVATPVAPVARRRLVTMGVAALAVLLALVGPVLAWTTQADDADRRAAGPRVTSSTATTSTTTSTPPATTGFVGAAGAAEPARAVVTLAAPAVATVPPPATTAAPTSTSTSTTTTTEVVVVAASESGPGRGRKPDKQDKPRNPHAASRDKR